MGMFTLCDFMDVDGMMFTGEKFSMQREPIFVVLRTNLYTL